MSIEYDTIKERRKEEDAFRLWAFHVYYDKAFAHEQNLTVRFANAIVASSRPVKNPALREAFKAEAKKAKEETRATLRRRPLVEAE
jgi:hypothetical protein